MLSLEEKKELVIANYQQSYDLEIAMMKVGLTSDEKKLLLHDESFMYRVSFADSLIREEIIGTMLDSMRSADVKLAQKAAIDLGNILWKDKFKGNADEGNKSQVPDQIILKGKKGKEE